MQVIENRVGKLFLKYREVETSTKEGNDRTVSGYRIFEVLQIIPLDERQEVYSVV